MGGAQRAERRRKKHGGDVAGTGAGTRAGGRNPPAGGSSGAASAGGPSRTLIAVIAVVVLAVVVGGGLIWQRIQSDPGAPEAERTAVDYDVRTDDGVVVAGADDAPVTVDIYEDFLCPACANFEQRDGDQIRAAIASGDIQARYHIVNILDEQSNPAGYSTDAGNAALCAAGAGAFPSFHASLLAKPPREGGRGYSIDQLVQLGRDLGVTDNAFEPCVRDGQHEQTIRDNGDAATSDPDLRRTFPDGSKGFGTPTVVVDGTIADVGDEHWLDQLDAS